MTDGAHPDETLNNVKEVESQGAPVVGFSSHERGEKYSETVVKVPEFGVLEPLVANVAMQLFAYHVADGRVVPSINTGTWQRV